MHTLPFLKHFSPLCNSIVKIMALWLLSSIGIRGTLTGDEVDIFRISEFKLIKIISNIYYIYISWDCSKYTDTYTVWTDGINHPIELIIILESSWAAASFPCFPSPQWPVYGVIVLLTAIQMMILVVHWSGSLVPPIHTGLSSISLYHPLWS